MFPLQAQVNTRIRSPEFRFKKKPSLPVPLPGAVGYAWFFENIVIYGDGRAVLHFIQTKKVKNFGTFLGVVKGLIPVDPYYVLYQWINSKPTPTIKRYLKRKAMRSLFKKLRKSKLHRYKFELEKHIKENTKMELFV